MTKITTFKKAEKRLFNEARSNVSSQCSVNRS